ncbi:hypothetical protein [Clostridium sp. AN503]|uniref:hypothetical protein n=1 Tax=Clostridium sp. AN503 TaxID=3160598 RepID=UPI003457F767
MNYVIIYSEAHEHMGLFNDLKGNQNVELIVAKKKSLKNKLVKGFSRLYQSWTLNRFLHIPGQSKWFMPICMSIDKNKEYCIIIIDSALKAININTMNDLFSKPNVRGVLVLINSMNAQSISMMEAKPLIKKLHWDDIYTFDPLDAEKFNFKYLGCCYYSKFKMRSKENRNISDVYFVGSIKGNRGELIISVFNKLLYASVNTEFIVRITGIRKLMRKIHSDKIRYISGELLPYDKIIAGVLGTKVILEILQKEQYGPSLRYYEAVCYNKKLLSNNPYIRNFPFFDERYMRVFQNVRDIDIEWILESVDVDYHYNEEFSPVNMLDVVLK